MGLAHPVPVRPTIINLLANYYTPTDGSLMVDGINIQELAPNDLRQHIAYVPQESQHRYHVDNCRFGRPDADYN